MSVYGDMEPILQDFLVEAGELLSGVDNKLVALEKNPSDNALLNDIFRGFHTIKGGAGFLSAPNMVELCHRTETVFDNLRSGKIELNARLMDVILDATAVVHEMFGEMHRGELPSAAPEALLHLLEAAALGEINETAAAPAAAAEPVAEVVATTDPAPTADSASAGALPPSGDEDAMWAAYYRAITDKAPAAAGPAAPRAPTAAPAPRPAPAAPASAAPKPAAATPASTPTAAPEPSAGGGRPAATFSQGVAETTLRIDTERFDKIWNLSGEVGLVKNRLMGLKDAIIKGEADRNALDSMDEIMGQLDVLVADLQNAVMKARMQPVGRVFQKYVRLVRDMARKLGKDVEMILEGEDTELDKNMLDDLNDPLIHLLRNAIDHGIESPEERWQAGKPAKSELHLSAEQQGGNVVIRIVDDGRGIDAAKIRAKAVEKGLIDNATATTLNEARSLDLMFMPGFSTKEQITDLSGRGVGLDVVQTNVVKKLNGHIQVKTQPGRGSNFILSMPLTLAVVRVLLVQTGRQTIAIPLNYVQEIISLEGIGGQHTVLGHPAINVRGEIVPVVALSKLLGWPKNSDEQTGLLVSLADTWAILAVDGFTGQEEAVIKSLDNISTRGVAGATIAGDGSVVLILDLRNVLAQANLLKEE